MPFYPQDFFGDERVAELTTTEKGLYLLALARTWQQATCSLPPSVNAAQKILFGRVKAAFRERKVIETFFPIGSDNRRRNPRQFEEWQRVRERSARAKSSAEARWRRCERNALPSPISHLSSPPSTTTTSSKDGLKSIRRANRPSGGGDFSEKVPPEQSPEPDAELDHPVARLQFLLGVAGADCEQAWRTHGHTVEDCDAWLAFRDALADARLAWCRSPQRYVAVQATRHRRPEDCDAWSQVHGTPEPPVRYHPYKPHRFVRCDGLEWEIDCDEYAKRPRNHPEFEREWREGLITTEGTRKK